MLRVIKRNYRVVDGKQIQSVADALEITGAIKLNRGEFALYRGQSVASWLLRPKVFRRARWYRHERDMIREIISTHPQKFSGDTMMLDRLVRMQHYGLPTRLLDVSQNFLVALFFATEIDSGKPDDDGAVFIIRGDSGMKKYYDSDTISLISNLSNLSEKEKWELLESSPENGIPVEDDEFNLFPATDRLLQFVRNEKPYFRSKAKKEHLFRTFFVVPKKNNRRIVAQAGAFLVYGLVNRSRSPDLSMFRITRHRVPKGSKPAIRDALEGLGVTESNLFPEIERAALRIEKQFRNI